VKVRVTSPDNASELLRKMPVSPPLPGREPETGDQDRDEDTRCATHQVLLTAFTNAQAALDEYLALVADPVIYAALRDARDRVSVALAAYEGK
jgi:hypothetical protein